MKLNSAQQKRQLNGLLTMSLFFVLSAYFFYFNSDKTEQVTYGFVIGSEIVLLNEWVVDSKRAVEIFLLLSLIGVLLSYFRFRSNKKMSLGTILFGFGLIMAFMSWAASGKFIPFTGLLQGAIMLSVPLIFGAMSGLICEKSGVINIAIEGQLLAAAFVSAVVASISSNIIIGLIS